MCSHSVGAAGHFTFKCTTAQETDSEKSRLLLCNRCGRVGCVRVPKPNVRAAFFFSVASHLWRGRAMHTLDALQQHAGAGKEIVNVWWRNTGTRLWRKRIFSSVYHREEKNINRFKLSATQGRFLHVLSFRCAVNHWCTNSLRFTNWQARTSCKKTAAHVPRKIYKTLMTFIHVHARAIWLWAWLTMAMLRWVSVHSARPHIETQWRRCAGAQRSSCCTAEHEWQTAVLQRMMQSASFGSLCMCAASISIFRWMDWCFLACGNAKPCSL